MNWKQNKWSLLALGVILGTMISTRGGISVLLPLLKFFVPALLIYFGFKYIKQKFQEKLEQVMKQQMGKPMDQGPFKDNNPDWTKTSSATRQSSTIIDLCPKCGSYLLAGHRCDSKTK